MVHAIVYTLINGPIQGIASIISSSFFVIFYIEWIYALNYRFKGCLSLSIKLSKNFSKTCNKRWTHFWEIQFQNYTTLYQRLWQQHEMHLLQIVRDTATLLYNRTMANMGYGQERLKDIVEKGAEEEEYEHWRKDPWLLKFFLDRFKTQEICMKALEAGLWQLKDVPDQYKSQEICDKAVRVDSWSLKFVSDHFKMQEMCNEAFEEGPCTLRYVLDHLKTRGRCNEAICETKHHFFLSLTVWRQKRCVRK